jgi:hypothetical protein
MSSKIFWWLIAVYQGLGDVIFRLCWQRCRGFVAWVCSLRSFFSLGWFFGLFVSEA